MMPVKLFQRMTTEQEAMAKAAVEGDVAAYEKAEAAQQELFEKWFRQFSHDQAVEWDAVCARLDAWVAREVLERGRRESARRNIIGMKGERYV